MNVRPATQDDIDHVQSVARAAWKKTYENIVPENVIEEAVADWYGTATLSGIVESDQQVMLVAEDDEEIVGFAHGVTDDARDDPSKKEGDILRLYVHPDHWNEGAGTALLDAIEDELEAQGSQELHAMVLADNEIGNDFYEDHGFRKEREADTKLGRETRKENVYVRAT
ncbi:GNAT family N-acetyltransferase [Halorussus halophilus]|uniref:GNAT family N-acetyltransferase n=1 Tax=Halorussus halophilus TaxID=2650975 RepID=UPI00130104CC|nr:GNAT family N-acetyltransferase [Halorussus halophilus]